MAVICAIQARMSSTRLPGKSLMDLGGKPLIKRVWDACQAPAWSCVVLTSRDGSDNVLSDYLTSVEIVHRRGSLTNVLSRYVELANARKPSVLIRVCGDSPFIQKRWIYRALEEVEKTDTPVFVPSLLHAGTTEHWLQCNEETDDDDKEHAGNAWFELYGHHIHCVPDTYLMVNTQEDLEEARRRWTPAHPGA